MSTKQLMRPSFFEGQYLGAEDLATVVDYARWEQARHLLGAHTWGIATGLRLVEVKDPANNTTVFVEPGYAWDGFGRPIVVETAAPVPADLFQTIAPGPDVLVRVWIRYRETATSEPPAGFETCRTGEQNTRVLEGFVLEVGDLTPDLLRSNLTIGGRSVTAETAVTPPNPDLSIPYQTFPVAGARWLLPLGMVKWHPGLLGVPGSFQSASDEERSRDRIYIGSVSEWIDAPNNKIRLKRREDPPSPVNSNDVAWVQGDLPVEGNIRPFGKALQLVDAAGGNGGVPLEITRSSNQMRVRLGQPGSNARLDIGPDDGTFHPKVSVLEGGELESDRGDIILKAAGADPGNIIYKRDATEKARIWSRPGADPGLHFSSGGTTAHLAIRLGQVGIGTPDPDRNLTIAGGAGTYLNTKAADGTIEALFGADGNGAIVSAMSNHDLHLRTGGNQPRVVVKATGEVGVGIAAPAQKLHVDGARVRLSNGPGKWIDLRTDGSQCDLESGTHSVFVRSSSQTAGQDFIALNPFPGDGFVAVGNESPTCKLHVSANIPGQADNPSAAQHVALVENVSSSHPQVLALRMAPSGFLGSGNNFITFYSGSFPIGSIERVGGGISLTSGSADFAEFFPLAEGEPTADEGEVLAIHNGVATRDTARAGLVSAASPRPAILAARIPGPGVSLGLLGQLMVKVRGPVSAGNLVLPSGANDGTAIALSPEAAAETGATQVIGIAWQSSAEAGVKLIRTAIGLCGPLLQLMHAKLARLEAAKA